MHFSHSFCFHGSMGTKNHHWGKGKDKVFLSASLYLFIESSGKTHQYYSCSAQGCLRSWDFSCCLNAHDSAPVRCDFLKGWQWEQVWLNFLKNNTRDICDAKATAATKFKLLFLSRGVQGHRLEEKRPTLICLGFLTEDKFILFCLERTKFKIKKCKRNFKERRRRKHPSKQLKDWQSLLEKGLIASLLALFLINCDKSASFIPSLI